MSRQTLSSRTWSQPTMLQGFWVSSSPSEPKPLRQALLNLNAIAVVSLTTSPMHKDGDRIEMEDVPQEPVGKNGLGFRAFRGLGLRV